MGGPWGEFIGLVGRWSEREGSRAALGAERAGDGREHGSGWMELGFVSVGGPAIGRHVGGDKKEQS